MTRRPLLGIAALSALLVLAGCGTPPPAEDPVDENPPASTAEVDPVGILLDASDAESVLVVYVEMTASNGATADVVMVVQKSTDWDDPAGADRAALMTQVCAGAYDESIYAMRGFTFALIRVTFTVTEGEWPAGEGVHLVPATDHLAVVSSGAVVSDPGADPESPNCKRDKIMTGPGEGTMVVAIGDDIGVYDKWAGHNYGFATLAGGDFTECLALSTDLGRELGWNDSSQSYVDETDICKVGDFTENDDS